MKHDVIIFDLDGTISDPLQGIARSVNYALEHYGYEPQSIDRVSKYIGPPIDKMFSHITGNNSIEELKGLVTKYRERYGNVGYTENTLYPGISESLYTISTTGSVMGICTSKRKDFAEKILGLFDLRHYFTFIDGGEVGVEKQHQLNSLLSSRQISQDSVMVGDRSVDLIAAQRNGLSSGGVLWGYGSHEELSNEQPTYLFNSPVEWIQLVA
jgi:phosphoglycolate phosphatase